MSFVEERINDHVELDFGTRGGPAFSVSVVENDGGQEERVTRWASPKRVYSNARFGRRKNQDVYALIEFYVAVQGPTIGFRFKDPRDYATSSSGVTHGDAGVAVTAADVVIGIGDGSETVFQLSKKYVLGALSRSRTIEKPVAGTVKVAVDGVTQVEGTDFTVNTATGQITFTVAPPLDDEVTAGSEFDVPVRFGTRTSLEVEHDSANTGTVSVELIEIRGEKADPEQAYNGGSNPVGTISVSVFITLSEGRSVTVEPDTASLGVKLPLKADVEPGGPIFLVRNAGSESIELQENDGTKIVDIPIGATVTVLLDEVTSGGARSWTAFG
ncbi:MAG: DUF2460 domain-containing protein [bacterium]|nr:DUF2460 domain-containing protein [bacterium]